MGEGNIIPVLLRWIAIKFTSPFGRGRSPIGERVRERDWSATVIKLSRYPAPAE
jgi:hypothetical protein